MGAPASNHYVFDIVAALSVGLSIFAMVVTNSQHPPATGAALGLVVHPWDYKTVLFVLVSVVVLSSVRTLLGDRLKNLL